MYNKIGKRILDLLISIPILLLLLILFPLLTVFIMLDSSGPVLYRCQAMGRSGIVFGKYKFRTMVKNADSNIPSNLLHEYKKNYKLQNDPRVTKLGKFLRKYSIDEFPNFINVFLGQMSVVGPRDLEPLEFKEKYLEKKIGDKLLSVKPGITGIWQVNGRSTTTYEHRMHLDMEYIDNYNIFLDLKLIFKTIPAVIFRYGAV